MIFSFIWGSFKT